jgi:cell division protein FtsL
VNKVLLAEKKAFAYPGEYTYKRTVTKPQPTTKPAVKAKVRYVLSLILVFALGLSVVVRYASMVELNYQINKEKSQLNELVRETETLKVKLAELKSYDRIEQIALTRLGMLRPGKDQLVYLGIQITNPK